MRSHVSSSVDRHRVVRLPAGETDTEEDDSGDSGSRERGSTWRRMAIFGTMTIIRFPPVIKRGQVLLALLLCLVSALFLSRPIVEPPNLSKKATSAFSQLPAASLQHVYEYNQKTRGSIEKWIKREDWESPPSVFNYGLPDSFFDKMNMDVGPHPIGHDVIGFFAVQLKKRVVYLEIGVSVGKCLYTQLRFLSPPSAVYAFDIEDINPTFAGLLEYNDTKKTWSDSKPHKNRVVDESIKVYTDKYTGTTLTYLASDEFSSMAWDHLQQEGEKFNLIYSDALHTGEALKEESTRLLSLSMVDLVGGYTILWDDCYSNLKEMVLKLVPDYRKATYEARRISTKYVKGDVNSSFCYGTFKIGGWVGEHERRHETCILSTMNLKAIVENDEAFGKLKWVEEIKCDAAGM